MSMPCATPKRRSARSFSVSDGRLTATPGRLMPLWSPIDRRQITSVRTSSAAYVEHAQFDRRHRPAARDRRVSRRRRGSGRWWRRAGSRPVPAPA